MIAAAETDALSLPPLLTGRAVPAGTDPLPEAARAAARGADPGLVVWSRDTARLRVAILLAPEVPLEAAIGAIFAVTLGFADALGALAPPETAVHFDWPGSIRVNGGTCGRVRAIAATTDPAAEPDWLAVGLEVALMPVGPAEPGTTPHSTTLFDEGCAGLTAPRLIESWSRHAIVWINRLVDDGLRPLHAAWSAHFDRIGTEVAAPARGRVLGLDPAGGLLLAVADGTTRLVPLTDMLEPVP